MFCKFQINSVLESMSVDEVYELCTSILANGQTIVHMLAQRQKLPALRAILKRGVDVNTRNAQGNTPLYVAFHHNALRAAKVMCWSRTSSYKKKLIFISQYRTKYIIVFQLRYLVK